MKVAIALFSYGNIPSECLLSHMDLIGGIVKGKLPWRLFNIREDALISRSRCRAVGEFMRATKDDEGQHVLVMIDHDIEFDPKDLRQMADLANEQQAIIAVPYAKRQLGAHSACRPANLPNLSMNTLCEVEYLGAGFCAVPRGTIERIILCCKQLSGPMHISWCKDDICDFWSLFQPFVLDGEYLSEDYAFCARARAAGIPVLAWCGPTLKHWGMHPFQLLPSSIALVPGSPQDASQPTTGPVIPPTP